MSVINRLLLGGALSWARLFITIISQIALVPIYLTYWDVATYGIWLATLAIGSLASLFSIGHQNFIGNEFLKIGNLNRIATQKILSSSFPFSLLIAFIELLVLTILVVYGLYSYVIDMDTLHKSKIAVVLIIQSGTWFVISSWVGILTRAVIPFGYYPRMAWWSLLAGICASFAPAIAVFFGANLVIAAISLSGSIVFYNIFVAIDVFHILKKENIEFIKPNYLNGLFNVYRSFFLAMQSLLEMARQQGSRIILAPLAGVADMAAFATMRTGANFALQGLNTITGPVMPELMRFLATRDQPRAESTFAIVWLMLCAVLSPAIVVVQWLAPALFPLWTHGKIAFDPWLFGMLSLGVAVQALAQPAAAVLQGNNILRAQLGISMVATTVAVGGMVWLVPHMGVRGAGLALLAAELTSLFAYVWVAQQWLRQQGMRWPWKAFGAAAAAVPVTALGMVALALLPTGLTIASLLGTLVLQVLVAIAYWRQLPALARLRAASLLARFLPASLRPAGTVATPPATNDTAPKN